MLFFQLLLDQPSSAHQQVDFFQLSPLLKALNKAMSLQPVTPSKKRAASKFQTLLSYLFYSHPSRID
ncbi:hypothetical protein C162_11566 [Paenibacillus sp. FSL R7-269]|nr:hypothetical protein C162_11566 [Paenibacillus sp. FSL R7-269]